MMDDVRKVKDLGFFHLRLYNKVNCNHIAITINNADKGPGLSLKLRRYNIQSGKERWMFLNGFSLMNFIQQYLKN